MDRVPVYTNALKHAAKGMLLGTATAILIAAAIAVCNFKTTGDHPGRDQTIALMTVAQARLISQLEVTAAQAGHNPEQIGETLFQITEDTILGEIWVMNGAGAVIYASHPDRTRPGSGEAWPKPFEQILMRGRPYMTSGPKPRERDGALYRYATVPRRLSGEYGIVHVGIAERDLAAR